MGTCHASPRQVHTRTDRPKMESRDGERIQSVAEAERIETSHAASVNLLLRLRARRKIAQFIDKLLNFVPLVLNFAGSSPGQLIEDFELLFGFQTLSRRLIDLGEAIVRLFQSRISFEGFLVCQNCFAKILSFRIENAQLQVSNREAGIKMRRLLQ